ncbi:glycosyltransferase family 2 protein [Microvirga sp. TS319]|uniref:glycosyltransferase family 2 protein n=1 Tax=Microvirga sp. TS319 TaxID=3241165 RepID=UPI00351A4998
MTDDRYNFGRDVLGPVVALYLLRLYGHAVYFEEKLDAKILFMSRAGIRIRRALETFVRSARLKPLTNADYLWASRFLIAKGTWRRSPDQTLQLILSEFPHGTVGDIVNALFRHNGVPSKIATDPALQRPSGDLVSIVGSSEPLGKTINGALGQDSEAFERYIESLLSHNPRALIVDTGWQATSQRLLAQAFPQADWWGAYFGRIISPDPTKNFDPARVIGLMFNAGKYDPLKPETCLVESRHLIESLFEPHAPSVERILINTNGAAQSPEIDAILADAPTKQSDPLFCGVLDYLDELPHGSGIGALTHEAGTCWKQLAEVIIYPTRKNVNMLRSIERSADFGRNLKVPIVFAAEDRHQWDKPELRVKESLWPSGQIALEYPPEMARVMQSKLHGPSSAIASRLSPRPFLTSTRRGRPAVAVITRTLDRPMFLRRAIESVHSQTFKDFVHVVVNDGGDPELAKSVIAEMTGTGGRVPAGGRNLSVDERNIILVDNVVNRGMEAASNIAIAACESDYIVIHDDDDTWEPTFLERTVSFLDDSKNHLYGGVITKSTYVSEEVTGSGIAIHGRSPYNEWLDSINIMELAQGNVFPPIAFVFRRDVYDNIGRFDERFPVLGDWDFNVRFLAQTDIGIVPEYLANYHHRDRGDITSFGNSVISGRSKHLEFASVVRNKLTRTSVGGQEGSLGALLGIGLHFQDLLRTSRESLAILRTLKTGNTAHLAAQSSESENELAKYKAALEVLASLVNSGDTSTLREIGLRPPNLFGLRRRSHGKISVGQLADRLLSSTRSSSFGVPDSFSEARYLAANPDVAESVRRGVFRSGWEHYTRHGRTENRPLTS